MIFKVRNKSNFANTLNTICFHNNLKMPSWKMNKEQDLVDLDDSFIKKINEINEELFKELKST